VSPLRRILEAIASGPQTLPGLSRLTGSPEPVVEGMLSTLVGSGYLEDVSARRSKDACPNCALKSLCILPTETCTQPEPPRLRLTERGEENLGKRIVA
jgi:hypothetical protein